MWNKETCIPPYHTNICCNTSLLFIHCALIFYQFIQVTTVFIKVVLYILFNCVNVISSVRPMLNIRLFVLSTQVWLRLLPFIIVWLLVCIRVYMLLVYVTYMIMSERSDKNHLVFQPMFFVGIYLLPICVLCNWSLVIIVRLLVCIDSAILS